MNKKPEFETCPMPRAPNYVCWMLGGLGLVLSTVMVCLWRIEGAWGPFFATIFGVGVSILWLLALLIHVLDYSWKRSRTRRRAKAAGLIRNSQTQVPGFPEPKASATTTSTLNSSGGS